MNCKTTWIKNAFLVLTSIFMFNACEDKMDEHYEVPEWLKGNAWEVLEARGNYSVFLEGADLAGFGLCSKEKAW